MKFEYRAGIHNGDEYDEQDFEVSVPVNVGDIIAFETGGNEFKVTDIVHSDQDITILHCKPVE